MEQKELYDEINKNLHRLIFKYLVLDKRFMNMVSDLINDSDGEEKLEGDKLVVALKDFCRDPNSRSIVIVMVMSYYAEHFYTNKNIKEEIWE